MKVPVRYTGSKPVFKDHLFGTGITWEFGQTEEVPAATAVRMLSFGPAFEDARKDTSVSIKSLLTTSVEKADPTEEELASEPPLVNLESMTKAQITEFAQGQFGVILDSSLKKDEMIDTVRRQMGRKVAR